MKSLFPVTMALCDNLKSGCGTPLFCGFTDVERRVFATHDAKKTRASVLHNAALRADRKACIESHNALHVGDTQTPHSPTCSNIGRSFKPNEHLQSGVFASE
jgi:hypothetical protein